MFLSYLLISQKIKNVYYKCTQILVTPDKLNPKLNTTFLFFPRTWESWNKKMAKIYLKTCDFSLIYLFLIMFCETFIKCFIFKQNRQWGTPMGTYQWRVIPWDFLLLTKPHIKQLLTIVLSNSTLITVLKTDTKFNLIIKTEHKGQRKQTSCQRHPWKQY